jgi:hypothetical protein
MTQPSSKPKRSKAEEAERSIVFWLAFAVLLLCCIPQFIGYVAGGPRAPFIGSPYNIDDYCVYLSWLKQTAAGHLFVRNLFTTDSQPTLPFYILFSVLGVVMRLTHLSAQAVILATRLIGAVCLLALIYRFYRTCLPRSRDARVTAFGFACLSSGFGWAVWKIWWNNNPHTAPVDAWQPEAYTFLSIYLEALFVVATILILGAIYAMLLCLRTGRTRYAVVAGLCVFLLGNFHSYDIVHIAAAWGLFLIVWTILTITRSGVSLSGSEERAGVRSTGANADSPVGTPAGATEKAALGRLWLQSILALLLAMPTTLYNLYVYRTNPVFSARAQSPAPTPPLWHYVLGYGIPFLLAVAALVILALRSRAFAALTPVARPDAAGDLADDDPQPPGLGWADRAAVLLAVCWAIAPFIVIELPGSMQWRKMIMGEHIPLCLLAGWGAAELLRRLGAPARRLALAALVLASMPSNLLFVARDVRHLETNTSETWEWPYLHPYQLDSLTWIEDHAPQNAALVGQPFYCLYIAALTGHPVWAGHWSETPDDPGKIAEFNVFADTATPDNDRRAFLASTGAQYLYYPNEMAQTPPRTDRFGIAHTFVDFAAHPPPYLLPVFENKEISIFKIDLSR